MSGVGGNPVPSVKMQNFDLIGGGKINLTPGVGSLILNSIGPDTQVNLRTLPPAPSYRILPANPGNPAGGQSGLFGVVASSSTTTTTTSAATGTVTAQLDHRDRHHGHGYDHRDHRSGGAGTGTTTTGTGSGTSGTGSGGTGSGTSGSGTETGTGGTSPGATVVPVVTGNSTSTGTFNLGTSSTLEAGQYGIHHECGQGITTSYNSNPNQSQTLVAVSRIHASVQPPRAAGHRTAETEPPAPPGIILKTNSIDGAPTTTVDLLTDSKIFGYHPKTGQVLRFDLNLANNTRTVDPTLRRSACPAIRPRGPGHAYNGSHARRAGEFGFDRVCLPRPRDPGRLVHDDGPDHLDRLDLRHHRAWERADQSAPVDQPDRQPPDRFGTAGGLRTALRAATGVHAARRFDRACRGRRPSSPRSRPTSTPSSPTSTSSASRRSASAR